MPPYRGDARTAADIYLRESHDDFPYRAGATYIDANLVIRWRGRFQSRRMREPPMPMQDGL